MRIRHHFQGTLSTAFNAGLWAVVFLDDRTGPGLIVVPLVMAAVVCSLRQPLVGALLLGVAQFAALLVGLPYGDLELFVGSMVVLGWAGRYGNSLWPGLLGIALSAVAGAMRDGFEVRKLAVTAVALGFAWLFGRLVRHRALAATAALQEAERLASTRPEDLAHPVARAERRHIAANAAANLRTAVHEMLTGIDEILADGTPRLADVRRVRERGSRTVDELRRLLVLLRSEPSPVEPDPAPGNRGLAIDLALAGVVAVVATAGLLRVDGWSDEEWLPLAYGALVVALALRSSATLAAGALLTLGMVPLVWSAPADPDALLPLAAGIAAVVWVLVDRPGRITTVVGTALTVTALALGTRYGLDGVAFIGVVIVVSFASGLAWGEPDRVLIRARERSGVLRSELEAATAEAVRQERLRIARDLHDATSHAVGVMLMQVSAAEAQIASSPERALAALGTAREAGELAREASNPLFPRLHEDAHLGAGSLRTEIVALLAQWRATGMSVTSEITLPDLLAPDLAVTCYRIVQEALTNCSRHAPGAAVSVRVLAVRRQLIIEIEDTGATRAVSSPPSGGWGLSGLRERVTAHRGHLSAGPHGPGHRVSVRLPLPPAPRSPS